jgi:hypothetical protein
MTTKQHSRGSVPAQDEALRDQVARGWTTLALILLAMNVVHILRQGVQGTLGDLAKDPGPGGVVFITITLTVYIVMPLAVRGSRGAAFRWASMAAAAIVTLAFIAHQVVHVWITADEPLGIPHVLDAAHHAVGIWLTITAARWARSRTSDYERAQ